MIGDTELFFRARADAASHLGHTPRIIAITGTNGKSTTSALTAHLLMSAGVPCALGGNIGDAVLGLPEFDTTRVYVVELSSYQIDLTPSLHPSAAALLNITPDHLDRHGTLQNYAAVKARIFAQLGAGDTAVVALDDPLCRAIAAHIPSSATRVTITAEATPASQDPAHAADLTADLTAEIIADLIAEQGRLFLRRDDRRIEAATFADNIALAGAHNGQNVAAAWMLASAVGTPPDALQHGLATFPGLAHRLEFVGHLPKRDGRILFVNDSKGTNADAAAHALAAFDDVFWIAGGRAKEGGIEPLAEHFPRVRSAFLVGEAARDFAATLEGHCPVAISGDVGRAVVEATTAAAQSPSTSPVVLLSPAAASFDQFADFEARGDAFKAKLADLPGFVSAAEARAARNALRDGDVQRTVGTERLARSRGPAQGE
ncbi:MAG: UDP-N-acetylmuramoyl-L-alanine--D-glutamate ligase, partial [Planctomycetota bacterium]